MAPGDVPGRGGGVICARYADAVHVRDAENLSKIKCAADAERKPENVLARNN